MKNLDAARRTRLAHRRCVATGRATLVVHSASGYASGSLEHQLALDGLPAVKGTYLGSVRGFALTVPQVGSQQPPHSFRRCLCTQACMTGYRPVGKRVATALPHSVVLPAGLLLTPPNTTGRT